MLQPCQDNYSTTFDSYERMRRYHEKESAESLWRRCKVNELHIDPLDKLSPLYETPSAFAAGVSRASIEDTAENLGLALQVEGAYYPVRSTAYKSLLDRAKINGTALPKLSRQKLASVLNDCLALYSAETLLLIRDEKISATHSGDSMDYSVLPIDELLKVLTRKLDDRFAGNVFQGGYCDHALAVASWSISGMTDSRKIIEASLKIAVEYYQADRAFVLDIDDELDVGCNTYEYCSNGVDSKRRQLRTVPLELLPKWHEAIHRRRPIIVKNVERLRGNSPDEFAYLRRFGVSSLCAVPYFRKKSDGLIGVDNPKLNVEHTQMLYSLARIVAMELCEMQFRERAALTARDTEHRDASHVHVNMFGRMEIIAHDGTLHDNAFQGSSSYNLFAFLVLNRKSEHPLYQLATMIWENGESENPFSSIRNVNSRLRKTLDYIGLGRLIQVEHKMLSLNPAYVITTDVDGFDELNRKILQVRNAADPDMAVLRRLYEQVLALYQGSLLPRQDHYHWVMAKAVAYQNQYLGILNDYLELLYKERQFVKVQKIASDSLSIYSHVIGDRMK